MQTNNNILIIKSTNNEHFLKDFQLIYEVPGYESVLEVNTTNYDFADTSLVIKLQEMKSNSFIIHVRNFELSNFSMPGLQVKALKYGKTNEFLTPAFPVEAQSLSIIVSNKALVVDIYQFRDFTFIFILIAFILIALLSIFTVRFIRRKKENQNLKAAELINPFDEALQKLEEIRGMQIQENNRKEIYTLISETVRRFFERIFIFPALELATSEILNVLKKAAAGKKLPPDFCETAYHILRICDRVKYAKHIPAGENKNNIIEEAVELILQVKEIEDKESEEKKQGEGEKE